MHHKALNFANKHAYIVPSWKNKKSVFLKNAFQRFFKFRDNQWQSLWYSCTHYWPALSSINFSEIMGIFEQVKSFFRIFFFMKIYQVLLIFLTNCGIRTFLVELKNTKKEIDWLQKICHWTWIYLRMWRFRCPK